MRFLCEFYGVNVMFVKKTKIITACKKLYTQEKKY